MAGIFVQRSLVLCVCMLYFYTEEENNEVFLDLVYM